MQTHACTLRTYRTFILFEMVVIGRSPGGQMRADCHKTERQAEAEVETEAQT